MVHVVSRWVSIISTYTLGLCILCHLWLEDYRADHCPGRHDDKQQQGIVISNLTIVINR